jgi:gamma-glutamyltranspeptidase / glutathione hydrolase
MNAEEKVMTLRSLAAALLLSISPVIVAQQLSSQPGQGRSMVVTKFGIVAAPQFLASQAGAHILEEGGNTIDAAIAANAVMGVVQPYYADMHRYVGDPRFTPIPVKELISKDLAAQRAKLIQMDKAACQVIPSDIEKMLDAHGRSTIYLSTIDKDGNIVSLIQSNFAGYGTGMVAPGLGFSFHNRGAGFELTPGLPNSLAGHKRPIIPAFMAKGDIHIGFGIMGGWNQAQAHAQFVADVVDYGMNVQAALEQPRFTKGTFQGCDVQMEETVPDTVRAELTKRGHVIQLLEPFSFTVGQGEAVVRDSGREVNFAGADPCSDGEAIPQGPGTK